VFVIVAAGCYLLLVEVGKRLLLMVRMSQGFRQRREISG